MCLNLCNVTTFFPLAFLSNTKPACHKLMHIASIIFFTNFILICRCIFYSTFCTLEPSSPARIPLLALGDIWTFLSGWRGPRDRSALSMFNEICQLACWKHTWLDVKRELDMPFVKSSSWAWVIFVVFGLACGRAGLWNDKYTRYPSLSIHRQTTELSKNVEIIRMALEWDSRNIQNWREFYSVSGIIMRLTDIFFTPAAHLF